MPEASQQEKIKLEKIINALEEIQYYAEGYDGPSSDHKGCKPNLTALEALVSRYPDGSPDPDDEETREKWFEDLMRAS